MDKAVQSTHFESGMMHILPAGMVSILRMMDPADRQRLASKQVQINLNPSSNVVHENQTIIRGWMKNCGEVSLLEAQLRGYGAGLGPTRRNLSTTGTPRATLNKVSHAAGDHNITTLIGDPVPRQGLVNLLPSRGHLQNLPLQQSLGIMVSERLQAIGTGTGAESGTCIANGGCKSMRNMFEAIIIHPEKNPGRPQAAWKWQHSGNLHRSERRFLTRCPSIFDRDFRRLKIQLALPVSNR